MRANRWLLGAALVGLGAMVGFFAARMMFASEVDAAVGEKGKNQAVLSALEPVDGSLSRFDRRLALESELFGAASLDSRLRTLQKMRAQRMDIRQILSHLATTDPETYIAMAAAEEGRDPVIRGQLDLAFVTLWQTDPALAEELAMAFPAADARRSGLSAIVREAISTSSEDEARRLVGKYSEYLRERFFAVPEMDLTRVAPALLELPHDQSASSA